MKRVAQFLRSVLPADPWQLTSLFGVLLVFVCGHASWRPDALLEHCGAAVNDPSIDVNWDRFRYLVIIFVHPATIISGIAGYCLCFWARKKQLQSVLGFVLAPALIATALSLNALYRYCAPLSVLHFKNSGGSFLSWLKANAVYLPAGPSLCTVGAALILGFAVRLALRKSVLPIEISLSCQSVDDGPWRRVRSLTFVLVGPYFLLAGMMELLVFAPVYVSGHVPAKGLGIYSNLVAILEPAVLLAVAAFSLKRNWRDTIRACLRLPKISDAAVAFAIPVGVTLLLPAARFVFDRVQWAARDFGRYSPPSPFSYFEISNTMHLFVFLTLFESTAEEIVFRGMMLPQFVRRYGTQRGIFLVGIVWAAIHFRSDSYSRMSFVGVLEQIVVRVGICLVLNYVLSWMTLRQGSVTCAAITHGVWNLLNFVPQRETFPGELGVLTAVLGVIALFLFRFWPIQEDGLTFDSAEAGGSALAT
jgi:membrane protease YdiL (CAAX protease family)